MLCHHLFTAILFLPSPSGFGVVLLVWISHLLLVMLTGVGLFLPALSSHLKDSHQVPGSELPSAHPGVLALNR
ncbi:hypothetical protein PVAP13_5NG131600 [Panicum virgatum]|uniref:Uncharacterized protein n=1 Tax=Panicum virgatum TaxID=38727 RepID=A0A8T0RQ40_PANVG|nr:hypothetical protein PVAP13_5NG131600 [Panicum virgatum]